MLNINLIASKMVPLVSFLAALRILTEAQICNNGEGKVVFEKVTAFQSTPSEYSTNSSQFEIITRTNIPPLKVLEECFHRCQEDRVNKIGFCNKFDFLPGKRIPEKSNLRKRTPKNVGDIKGKLLNEYDQSSCVLYNQPNGSINFDDISTNHGSVWQFDKVCLSAQQVNKNCPNRPFVFEKIPAYKLIDTEKGKEFSVTDKNECENRCLMEREFTCRSASFKSSENKCYISPLNRHVAPAQFKSDPDFVYLENMCLKNNEMCKWSVLIIEKNKQMDSTYEKHSTVASSVANCSTSCLESLDKYGFVCRSFMFDDQSQQCILYDEDPVDMATNTNETDNTLINSEGNLYRVLCSTDEKDKDLDNKTLECYRHKRLRGRHQMEIYAMNFYECLSGCMKKFGLNCRSIEYSHMQKVCRFSPGTVVGPVSRKDTDALIDDDSFDYYQFMWNDQPPNHVSPLNDRHDAIETSYSQPGNYKNFILPSERARDHHRGGFAYNTNDIRPPPPSSSSSATNANSNNAINQSPLYTFQIEQKQQPETDGFDRGGSAQAYPQVPNVPKPQTSNTFDQTNQIYTAGPQSGQQGSQTGSVPYDRISPDYVLTSSKPSGQPDKYGMNQFTGKPQSDFRTFDPNNQVYTGGQRPTTIGSSRYDPGSAIYNIPQQRDTEFNSFDGTPSIYPMPAPTTPGQLDRFQMNRISAYDPNKLDSANQIYPFQSRSPPGSGYYDQITPGYLMPSKPFGNYGQVMPGSAMSGQPYGNYDHVTPGNLMPSKPHGDYGPVTPSSSMSSQPYMNYDIRPSQPINSAYPSSTYIYQVEQKQQPESDEYGRTPSIYQDHRRPQSNLDNNNFINNNGPPTTSGYSSVPNNSRPSSNMYDVRPSQQPTRSNIVYPSPTYIYHVEQQKQPDQDGFGRTPPINQITLKPYHDPNKYDATSQIQSPIYSVPSKPDSSSYAYTIPYRQSQPDMVNFKLSPTPTISHQQPITSATIYHGGRGSLPTSSGMINNQSLINMNTIYTATPNPFPFQNGVSVNGYKPRTSSIKYPSLGYNSYGYSMGRNPTMAANGGYAMNNLANYSGIMHYGPYGQMSQTNGLPFNGVHQTQINTIPSNMIGHNLPLQPIAYDRFGQLAPTTTSTGSGSGTSGITSSGCISQTPDLSGMAPFKKMGFSSRLKSKHIYKVVRAERLEDCERYCLETKDFICKSFNFRPFFPDNCELSNVDSKKFKLEDPNHFEHNTQFDYYERDEHKTIMMANTMDCFEVLQTCSPEGMELKLKTPEGFYGRIYTYGFYDSCFFDGNGGTVSVLKISKPNGFPRCGTQQISPDAMTNIVVVQFNDFVQTSRDKKYNLTCYISGPGEAVVTSNYLDTKTDARHPMQIEHLPAQNVLTSNIVLRILYRGQPTNTIVVGDLLTFRLEARNQYRFNGYYNDIFATNVIAKDPYTGRQVLLIDSRGCPVDLYVFPELHKTPDGALEAEFYAFKIPDSNFLVFQATVKTCKGPCEPVICTEKNRGQSYTSGTKTAQQQNMVVNYPSWGRRRRSIDAQTNSSSSMVDSRDNKSNKRKSAKNHSKNMKTKDEEEEVHELLRVYLQQEDVPESQMLQRQPEPLPTDSMCIDKSVYYLLMTFTILFFLLFIIILPYCVLAKWMKSRYETNNDKQHYDLDGTRGWMAKLPRMSSFMMRSKQTATTKPINQTIYGQRTQQIHCKNSYQPSKQQPMVNYTEPIYQDLANSSASAIERSRSMQSLTIQDQYNKTRINVNYE